MNNLEFLEEIFKVCIIPLLGILTSYIVKYFNSKINESKTKTDSETAKKYLDLLDSTIENCVVATNQTYVSALKEKNEFNLEAQKEAFSRTFNAVCSVLTQEARKYLGSLYNDLDKYIENKIEFAVNKNKESK